jgi:hypothetical protein
MKRINLLFAITLVFLLKTSYSQNLVPNPSFEIYDTCPDNLGQISRAIGWHDAIPDGEYFNVCSHDTNGSGIPYIGVPLNTAGYRTPASGNGYARYYCKGRNE